MPFSDGVLDVVGSCLYIYSQIGDSKNALHITIYSKLSLDFVPLWSRFWEFWANII